MTLASNSSVGNSGQGGDILYRWGNPQAYNQGDSLIVFEYQHDAHWIPPACQMLVKLAWSLIMVIRDYILQLIF